MLRLEPLAPALGAEVHDVDLSVALSGETVSALRAAWLEHLVLIWAAHGLRHLVPIPPRSNSGRPQLIGCFYRSDDAALRMGPRGR